MSENPYDPDLITPSVYGNKRPVIGEVIAILNITFKERGLKLISSKSRALIKNEIHELMITDESTAAPGGVVDRVSAIAFFETKNGGLVVVGDTMTHNDSFIGVVAGFDMTHIPNHMNVLLKTESLKSPSINVGDQLRFIKSP
jgi:hypothetical protein